MANAVLRTVFNGVRGRVSPIVLGLTLLAGGVAHAATAYYFLPANYKGDIADAANWNTTRGGGGTPLSVFDANAFLVCEGGADGRGQDHQHQLSQSKNLTIYGLSLRVGDSSTLDLGGHTITCTQLEMRHSWSPNSQAYPTVIKGGGTIAATYYYAEGASRFSGANTRIVITATDDSKFRPQSTSGRGLLSVTDGAYLSCDKRAWLPESGSNMKIEVVGAGSRMELARCDTRQASATLTAKDGGVFKCDSYYLMAADATDFHCVAAGGTLDMGSFAIWDNVKSPTTFDVSGDGLVLVRGQFQNQNFGTTFNVSVPSSGYTTNAVIIVNGDGGTGATRMWPKTVFNVTAADGTVMDRLGGQVIRIFDNRGKNTVWDNGVTINLGPEFTLESKDVNGLYVRVKEKAKLGFKGIEGSDLAQAGSWTNAPGVDATASQLNGVEEVTLYDGATAVGYRAILSEDMSVSSLQLRGTDGKAALLDLGGHMLTTGSILNYRQLTITNGTVQVEGVSGGQMRGDNGNMGLTVGENGVFRRMPGTANFFVGNGGNTYYIAEKNGIVDIQGSDLQLGSVAFFTVRDNASISMAAHHVRNGCTFTVSDNGVFTAGQQYFDENAKVTYTVSGNGTINLDNGVFDGPNNVGATVNISGVSPHFNYTRGTTGLVSTKNFWTFNFTADAATPFTTAPVAVNGPFNMTQGTINVNYTMERTQRAVTIPLIEVSSGNTLTIGEGVTIAVNGQFKRRATLRKTATGLYLDIADAPGLFLVVQ